MSINLENREPPSTPRTPGREMPFVFLGALGALGVLGGSPFQRPEESK
jgi:hypothetical protein